MAKYGRVFQSILDAISTRRLIAPFGSADFKEACPGFAANTYRNFLAKHAQGNPNKTTELFERVGRGLYCLSRSSVERERQERRRLRLLYSLGDFQLASSAATFLFECDLEENYTKGELRRFRCYETTVVIAYTRPFSASNGETPRLSLKMTGAELSAEQKALHARLIEMRNKVLAHSDAELMRMVSKTHSLKIGADFDFTFLETVFDEGLNFLGHDLIELDELILIVSSAVYKKLLLEANETPDNFNLKKDYLDAKEISE